MKTAGLSVPHESAHGHVTGEALYTDDLVSRFQFVEDHMGAFGVKRLCQLVEIARSSFYAWLNAAPSRAARAAAEKRNGEGHGDDRRPCECRHSSQPMRTTRSARTSVTSSTRAISRARNG